MVRAGSASCPLDVTVFYGGVEPLDAGVRPHASRSRCAGSAADAGVDAAFKRRADRRRFDYVRALRVVGHVQRRGPRRRRGAAGVRAAGRRVGQPAAVDARHRGVAAPALPAQRRLRVASAIGSHLLSAAYLLLYGRYISDTLSGVRGGPRGVRRRADLDSEDKLLNQRLLSRLLRVSAPRCSRPRSASTRFAGAGPPDEHRRGRRVPRNDRALALVIYWSALPSESGRGWLPSQTLR